MSRQENDGAARNHNSESAPSYSDSVPLGGREPELKAINSENISEMPSVDDSRPKYFKDTFAKRKWHQPYADALLEGDPSKIPAAIANAEDAIFNRYLELSVSRHASDETVDLMHAVDALLELKDKQGNPRRLACDESFKSLKRLMQ